MTRLVPIPGCDGYFATANGRIYSRRKYARNMKLHEIGGYQRKGYRCVGLRIDGKLRGFYVSRLVLTAFVRPPKPGEECLHGDGDPTNNNYKNLRWGTHAENSADSIRHGTSRRGEKNPHAKISRSDVLRIRELSSTLNQHEIATMIGISPKSVSSILTGRRWGWL